MEQALAGVAHRGEEAGWRGAALPGDVEGHAVIGRRAAEGRPQRDVDSLVERLHLEGKKENHAQRKTL